MLLLDCRRAGAVANDAAAAEAESWSAREAELKFALENSRQMRDQSSDEIVC